MSWSKRYARKRSSNQITRFRMSFEIHTCDCEVAYGVTVLIRGGHLVACESGELLDTEVWC